VPEPSRQGARSMLITSSSPAFSAGAVVVDGRAVCVNAGLDELPVFERVSR
jgi:hypothetical protein